MKKSKFDVRRTVEIEGLGKITASQSTLNFISIALKESAILYRLKKYDFIADLNYKRGQQIYEALESFGFYIK